MEFVTAANEITFEIPDNWWTFAEMDGFRPSAPYYLYDARLANKGFFLPTLAVIQPPVRHPGVPGLQKNRLLPVLFAFTSAETVLPPIEVASEAGDPRYRYRVVDGFHRFYASVAAGFLKVPANLID